MKSLYIIGAGGFGREVAWLVERINAVEPTWLLEGFIDDNPDVIGTIVGGYPVIGGVDAFGDLDGEAWTVCAIGSAKVRRKVIEKASEYPNVRFATLIDPSVLMSDRVIIGEGSIVCAGNIVTVDITLGNHCIVNLDCTIGHDAVLGDYVTVYPSVNISGITDIGDCVELGTGMQIIQGKTIGSEAIVGAGAVVVKDIPARCVAVGSPAKPIRFFE
ncbi:MAG: acetyltransferase [Atopobiaceae bacterium]|nr:acetyltransferase [Atopobiaceae bacterium]